jgi:hypothetical protein
MRVFEQDTPVSHGFLGAGFADFRAAGPSNARFTGSSAGNFALCSGLMEDKVEKE